ncbi:D-isomer specific 2-hydroxyacid dehydrogenase family protein [Actinacidiphila sp. ITFR-21]|uniref:D-isomer specific 2-hydroxyacid dehydrogenase family protein n=1 Tax=Actinacidiphila sp. ITFR-21 TaxID=3075199 RepID=UPI0028898398|nr:D-isomer specific 2-hydroxyacid dehydrogenase family protein [Streptomyces sp. ITFR-21]WNI18659.1 D-isomer specific 2-hydroxyacid dehydrogenase family protein [Streptomyces sp. ITFR-21]
MRILVSGGSVPARLADYCRRRDVEVDHVGPAPAPDELRRRVTAADYYLLGGDERLSKDVLAAAGRLRCVSFMGVGAGSFVDLEAARERGIRVLTTPGTNGAAVAEFAVGLALGVMRRILPDLGGGQQRSRASTELTGARVGVLGLGASGSALAGILARGFGCEVLYHSRTRKPRAERELGLAHVGPAELFTRSTTVFVCCALNEQTAGLVDDRLLGAGPAPRYLVSTADPRVIDPAALLRALETGALTGAAMDGFYQEPLPSAADDPTGLLRLQGGPLFVTGHIGASSAASWSRMEDAAVGNLLAVLDQEA